MGDPRDSSMNSFCRTDGLSTPNFNCFYLNCSNNDYCAERFENAFCDPICNNEACLKDGLDCETGRPELVGEIVFDCL